MKRSIITGLLVVPWLLVIVLASQNSTLAINNHELAQKIRGCQYWKAKVLRYKLR